MKGVLGGLSQGGASLVCIPVTRSSKPQSLKGVERTIQQPSGLQDQDEQRSPAIKPEEVKSRFGGKPLSDSGKCTSTVGGHRAFGVVSAV
jgi:hypothetical protein